MTGGWGYIDFLVFDTSSAAPFFNKCDLLCILLPFFCTANCFKHDEGRKTRGLPYLGKGTTIWSTQTTAYSQLKLWHYNTSLIEKHSSCRVCVEAHFCWIMMSQPSYQMRKDLETVRCSLLICLWLFVPKRTKPGIEATIPQ